MSQKEKRFHYWLSALDQSFFKHDYYKTAVLSRVHSALQFLELEAEKHCSSLRVPSIWNKSVQ